MENIIALQDNDDEDESDDSSSVDDLDDDDITRFNSQLDKLRYGYNPPTKFEFYRARLGTRAWPTGRWTIQQAGEMLEALLINQSVVSLGMDLRCCSCPAISVFLDFVQSTPRLQELAAVYDSTVTPDEYKTQMSRVVRAALRNPSIKKLSTDGLFVFDAIIADEGSFAATSIESLSIGHERPNKAFYLAIPTILRLTPSLKKLELDHCDGDYESHRLNQTPADDVFWALAQQQSTCSGLENFELNYALLGKDEVDVNFSELPSIQNANHSLQVLHLNSVDFASRRSVRLLWNLIGLKKLVMSDIGVQDEHITDADDDDEDDDNEEDTDPWAEFIRRNKELLEVEIDYIDAWEACAMGIVRGACGHESLQTLRLVGSYGRRSVLHEHAIFQLGQMIRTNKTLQSLTLSMKVPLSLESAAPLVEGIFENTSLQCLSLHGFHVHSDFLTSILEYLSTINETLKTFDIESTIEGGDTQTICRGFSRLFRTNTSLTSIGLPKIGIDAENMNLLVSGLVSNRAMKSVDFNFCTLDPEAWTCLERALLQEGPNKVSISSIKLSATLSRVASGVRPSIVKSFLRSLPRMPFIKKVEIYAFLDAEEKQLLLQAAKDKKTLLSFTTVEDYDDDDDDDDEWRNDPVVLETKYWLKLNRFGRQILDQTNVHTSLWPMLFSRMAKEQEDVDALYFFLGEYFANYSGGGGGGGGGNSQAARRPSLSPRPRQERLLEHGEQQQSSRPSKIARFDYL